MSRGLMVRAGLVAAVLSVVGVGTAAGSNALPSPFQEFVHTVFGGIGVPAPSAAGRDGTPLGTLPTATGGGPSDSSTAGGGVTPRRSSSGGSQASGPSASDGASVPSSAAPSDTASATSDTGADITGLCQTYEDTKKGSGLTTDQLARLASLAGGKQHIGKYCKDFLADDQGATAPTTTMTTTTTTTAAVTTTTGKKKKNSSGTSDSTAAATTTTTVTATATATKVKKAH